MSVIVSDEYASCSFGPPEADRSCKIAHLSDLHLGRGFDPELWQHICFRLERWQPNVIVISGDLVNNPWPRMLLEAKLKIAELKKQCGNPLIVIVPGNHDVGITGNVPMWFLSKIFFCIFDDGFDDGLLERYEGLRKDPPGGLLAGLRHQVRLYATVFKWCLTGRLSTSKGSRTFPKFPAVEGHVWLAAINSNHSRWRNRLGRLIPRLPRLATGFVSDDQIEQLARSICNGNSNYQAAVVRIVVMHHHPLPLSYSDQREGLTRYEPFLVLRNAGTVLRAFIDNGVDIVLHGHKHLQHFGRVDFGNHEGQSNPLAVVAAGSAGVRMKGAGLNSMNFILIQPHGRILVDTLRLGGGQYPDEPDRVYEEDFAHVKRRNWRRAREAQAISAEHYEGSYTIDEDGTAHASLEVKGFRPLRSHQIDARFRSVIVPKYGSLREGRVSVLEPYRDSGLRVDSCVREGNQYQYTLRFPQTVAERRAVDWGVAYESRNCFCLSRWEAERRGRSPQEDFAIVVTCPYRWLWFRIELPRSLRHRGLKLRCERPRTYPYLDVDASSREVKAPWQTTLPQVAVADGLQEAPVRDEEAFIRDEDITAHEQPGLTMLDDNLWQLKIERPLVGYKYVVYWELPDERASHDIAHGTKKYHDTLFDYRTRLMNDSLSEADKKCRDEMDLLYEDLHKKFASQERNEGFAAALMSFDAGSNRLFIVDIKQRPEAVRPWEFRLGLGEGLSGAAFKVRKLLIGGLDPDGNPVGDIFVPPPGTDLQAMISVPVFHPDVRTEGRPTPDAVIGVVSFGSSSVTSPINKIVAMSHDDREKHLVELRSVVQGTVESMLDVLFGSDGSQGEAAGPGGGTRMSAQQLTRRQLGANP